MKQVVNREIVIFLLWFAFIVPTVVNAKTLTCGLKKVTLSGNTITKIVHEDGTVHTGHSVSNNWTYDGKAIMHRIMKNPIPCSNKSKSRDEVIAELSGRFSKNPKSYGMTSQEADLMRDYTAKLMKENNECYLLVDAAKSTLRKGMFYIDCNNRQSKTKRYWISQNDLRGGAVKKAASPVSSSDAIAICNKELKARVTNPGTYDPSLTFGTTNRAIERTGRNVVEIDFEASNAFGVVGKYVGRCILESGTPIEVTIRNR